MGFPQKPTNKPAQLGKEIQVHNAIGDKKMFGNRSRKFKIAVFYRPRYILNITIAMDVFSEFISANGGCVMVPFIGHYTRTNKKMTPFDAAGPVLLHSNDDAISANVGD